MEGRSRQVESNTSFITYAIVAIILIAIATILMRFQPGLLGIVLTALTAGLAFYWIKELNKNLRKSMWKDLLCELREEDDHLSLTAQVPGPAESVRIEVLGKKLLLRGGLGFKRVVNLPYEVKVMDMRYVNGILNAKLVRKEATAY